MYKITLFYVLATSSYCQPTDSCWPSSQVWNTFNSTVKGRLVAVAPIATVCYTQGTTSPGCVTVTNNWTNPYYRASQPGAAQFPIWEEDTLGNNCFNPSKPCTQGNIPPYAVAVQEVADISLALSFANKYNIRVVIKTSGHEFQGRSTAAGALLIWMYKYKNISINENYTACSGDPSVPAVIVTGSAAWGEVYAAVAPKYGVVGGSARTVAACGGYTLGGGHSFMSPAFGLAVDNVLAFSAVLANGTSVSVSACSYPDLFWALRGGGGGSFAVVTSAVYRLHPTPADGVTGFSLVVVLLQGTSSVSKVLDGFLLATPNLLSPSQNGSVWGGYFYVKQENEFYNFQAYLVYNGTISSANASLQQFQTFLTSNPNDFYIYSKQLFSSASMNDWHDVIDLGDPTGTISTLGSRLIPLSACTDSTLRATAVTAMTNLASQTYLYGHLVAGGAVAALDRTSTQTSVTPAWRDAVWHLVVASICDETCGKDKINEMFTNVTTWTDTLRKAFPNSGAYFSESDYNEPDWQISFWGRANYQRLQQIKARYDPTGIFQCHHCVTLPNATSTIDYYGNLGCYYCAGTAVQSCFALLLASVLAFYYLIGVH